MKAVSVTAKNTQCQSDLGARGPQIAEVRLKVFSESRITYHINHSIPVILIHSVYGSSKVSERDSEKLLGFPLKLNTSHFFCHIGKLSTLVEGRRNAILECMDTLHKIEVLQIIF